MAVFDPRSRYARPEPETFEVSDIRGRTVRALPMREPISEVSVGEHVLQQGQRLDHISFGYLKDPHGFWRIAELNNAVLPDSLIELERLKIPLPRR